MQGIWDNLRHFVSTWGTNPLVDTVVGSLITLTVVFFRQLWRFFSSIAVWLWHLVRKQRKDYAFEKAYLSWMIDQHRYLGLLPARIVAARWGEGRRIVDMEKVYVTLQVSTQGREQGWTETSSEEPFSWRKQPWFYSLLKNYFWLSGSLLLLIITILAIFIYLNYPSVNFLSLVGFPLFILILLLIGRRNLRKEERYQLGDLGQAINRHKQLVIRGDPGSGKTTLLRYLAVTCARSLRNDKKQRDAPNMVRKRLLWSVRPFPILVTLRRHNDVTSWGEKKHLIDAFFEEIPVELRKRCPEGFFERQLDKGNCLILLDAFDELGSPEARAAMARRIGGFLNISHHPSNRVVVTTRIVGYEGQLDQHGFHIQTVQNLKTGEIRALIRQRYRAIALSETAGWQPHDAAPILQDMRQRAERLIKKIESTPRLAQLAMNPLLLSLIVLVHYVKVELPQERIQLYRDCVEILTEQWQRSKQAEIDMQPTAQEDLTLSHKLVLLQAIALAMQQQRAEEDRQTLLPRTQIQEIIARKLPNILGSQLPSSEQERLEMCRRKAEAWIEGIQIESGILVEQGLDEAGNPLIGFSHLTFQEYLAAAAIHEDAKHQRLLISNLLHPAWREVVLLYVALTNDATSTITHLLNASTQPVGILLAGSCLAERVKNVRNEIYQLTLNKLKAGFEQVDASSVETFGQVLAAIGGDEVTTFMRQQLDSTVMERCLAATKALGQIKPNDPQIADAQKDLVRLVETANDVAIMIASRESLAQIGDPRFTGKEPMLVPIAQQACSIPSSPKQWKELIVSPEWVNAKKLQQKLSLLGRVLDYWLFTHFHPLRQKLPQKQAFEMGKYLITNIEYARFIEATGHSTPKYWTEGAFPAEKATHPVTGVTVGDAKDYCRWLSQETGKMYRLPTEWEWEWAATGPQGWKYPWGEQFDKDKCNTKEAAIGDTTPVGSFLVGANQYGVIDMGGNVWEATQGVISATVGLLLGAAVVGAALSLVGAAVAGIAVLLVGWAVVAGTVVFAIATTTTTYILRGGAFDSTSDKAICFFRTAYSDSSDNVGFRCVRDL